MFKKIALILGLLMATLVFWLVVQFGIHTGKFKKDPAGYYRVGLASEIRNLELHQAAFIGNKAKVLKLIENGHDIHAKNTSFNFTPFHTAIFNGNTNVAELLLSKGANIDETSSFNQTPLHWAAMMGQEGSVKFLVVNGASLENLSEQGWTAIHIASRMGHINIVKILIEKGAQKDRKTPEGQTAQDVAKAYKHMELARYLGSID